MIGINEIKDFLSKKTNLNEVKEKITIKTKQDNMLKDKIPGPLGAHNWQAMSIDLDAGLAYIPTQENPFFYAIQEDYKKTGVYKRNPGGWNMGVEMSSLAQNILNNLESQPKPGGFLKAFDPLTGETKWSVPIPHYWNGGVLATAGGLVFQGDALGMFSAYDKETGERLWHVEVKIILFIFGVVQLSKMLR